MTTYNTGNPVPSADARDRYDNSQTLDEVVNGDSESYSSRTGKQVISLGGMNSRFNNAQDARESAFNLSQEEKQESFQSFLDGTGWSSLGAYGAGVVITSHTQTVDYLGQPYSLKPSIPASLDAPYVTTGVWATEGVNFKLVGDNSLRQDLSGATTSRGMHGYARAIMQAAIADVNAKLDSTALSVWEKANLITVRPTIDPSSWDWTPAIQAALDIGGRIELPENFVYQVSASLQMRSNTELTINGTLRFAPQTTTLKTDHLLICGAQGDPRVNVTIGGFGTVDGNFQNRGSFAPVSGAYLILAREVSRLRIRPGLSFINAPSSAIAGVTCNDASVIGVDIRNIREHGIYFSTDSAGLKILFNTLNDLAVGAAYSSDAIKLRNNCSNFLIQGNTLNETPLTVPNVVRGIVLDESDNVSPIVHTVCHDGKILDNTMLGLSTGIWLKGALIDASISDALFEMRVEISRNTFEAKATGSLFAGILDRVRDVDMNDNTWRNFTVGVYGGGVGDIRMRRNKIKNAAGSSSDGVRMVDTVYNDLTTASRKRGDLTFVENSVTGYNGDGLLISVADANDEVKRNKIVTAGRVIHYRDLNLSTAPSSGSQIADISDNPRLISTGDTAVFLNARAAITVKYRAVNNAVKSPTIGFAFSIVQDSSLISNQIDAPNPINVGSGSRIFREGNFNPTGPLAYTLETPLAHTFISNESGITLANVGATVVRTHPLPAAIPGLTYTLLRVSSFAVRAAPVAGETIRGGGPGKYINLAADGDSLTLKCMVAGFWEVLAHRGTPTFEP